MPNSPPLLPRRIATNMNFSKSNTGQLAISPACAFHTTCQSFWDLQTVRVLVVCLLSVPVQIIAGFVVPASSEATVDERKAMAVVVSGKTDLMGDSRYRWLMPL